MPLLINSDTGLAENAPESALQAGTHEVPLFDKEGKSFSAPLDQASDFIVNGYNQPTPEQQAQLLEKSKFNSMEQKLKTGAEGVAAGLAGPLAAGAEKIFGVDPEDIRKRAKYNPWIKGLAEVAGLASPVGEGAVLAKAGKAVADAAAYGKIGSAAVRGAVETALFQGGDEISKMIQEDPHQSVSSAISNIGLSGILGLGGGAALGVAGKSWDALMEGKATKFVDDMKQRVGEHLAPEPGIRVSEEGVHKVYDPFTKVEREVAGAAPTREAAETRYDPFTKKAIKPEVAPPQAPEEVLNQVPVEELKQKLAPGASLIDDLLKKQLEKFSPATIAGTAIGGALGHPVLGGIVGRQVLGPLVDSVLPGILRPIMNSSASGGAFRAAVNYGAQIVKGEGKLGRAAQAIFSGASEVPMSIEANKRDAIKNRLDELALNQSSLLGVGGQLGHYLPQHASALAETTARVVNYVQSQKPDTAPKAPLDPKSVPNAVQESNYNRVIDIAENPLSILTAVRNGRLTPKDLHHLNSMYPSMVPLMQQKVMSELINHKAAGKTVPYATQLGLSTIMAQPLASSMNHNAIAASQPVMQSGQSDAQNAPKRHNFTSLAKLPQSNMTPGQARQQSRLRTK